MFHTIRPPFALPRRLRWGVSLGAFVALASNGVNACPQHYQNGSNGRVFEIVNCEDGFGLEEYAENGGDLNVQDRSGYTALWTAIVGGRLEVASKLIQLGADVNAGEEAPISALIGSLSTLRESATDIQLIALIDEFAGSGANFDIRGATGNHLLIEFVAGMCELPSMGSLRANYGLLVQLRPHRVSLNSDDRLALDHLRTLSALGLYDETCVAKLAGGTISDG